MPDSSLIDQSFSYCEVARRNYEENGYHLFDRFLSREGLQRCRELIDEMLDRLQSGRSPEDIISPHQQERWLFELATHPRILDMVEAQIGSHIVLWSSHLLCKPPKTGRTVPWHQDAPYWNVSGQLAAGLWIAFDNIDATNGAMFVLPGWHRKGTLPVCTTKEKLFAQYIDPAALPQNLQELKVEYRLQAGQAAIHDTMIPHYSLPNVSQRWRRVLVLRYMSADGRMGTKEYEDYRTGAAFPREFYLVRGRDLQGLGLKTNAFDD